MSLKKAWHRVWNNDSFRMIRRAVKNFNNKEFFSKQNVFEMHSYGNENQGIPVYRIWIDSGTAGFFAMMRFVLDGLYVADRGGLTPYIRITNTKYNIEGNPDDNLFNCYYEQPGGLSDSSVNNSAFVLDFDLDHRKWLEGDYTRDGNLLSGYDFDDDLIGRLAEMSNRYIRINHETSQRLEEDMSKVISGEKTLGIHYRGNAFKVGFKGHPVGLDIQDYYTGIDEALSRGFSRIFVASDDANAVSLLSERYSGKVLFYSDTARSSDGIDVHDQHSALGHTGHQIGYEVLRDMMTLSRCDGLICGKSQVSIAVLIEKRSRSEEFDYLNIIDKGIYSDNSKNVDKYMDNVQKIR